MSSRTLLVVINLLVAGFAWYSGYRYREHVEPCREAHPPATVTKES